MLRPAAEKPDQRSLGDLVALLMRAEASLEGAGSSVLRYVSSLALLRERLVEERLQVAVLGQFKRGKSTFLNALLGASVLPTGVVPLTAIATFIRWAAEPSIRIAYFDDRRAEELGAYGTDRIREQLARFVTEEGNPHNRLKVARVDLFFPAPILRHGIVLIDTPGVGSTLRHNTEAAVEVLPECDAGFFVLSADPPVTEAELAYLDQVRPNVAQLFFVLNKIDYLGERDRKVAIDFLRRALSAHMPQGTDIPIFTLSSRRALEARETGDPGALMASGLSEIERRLFDFLANEKVASLRRAVAAKAGTLIEAAGMNIALGVRALELPLEDLKKRAGQFAQALEGIERQRLIARDLLAGDRRRALEVLEEQAEELRCQARDVLLAVLDRAVAVAPEDQEAAAKAAIATAIPEFFGLKLDDISRSFATTIEAMLAQHVEEADSVIASVRNAAAALFEIPSIPIDEGETFLMARQPFWVTQKWDETIGSLAGGAADRLLPARIRGARIRNRIAAQLDDLVQRNVENLRWTTLQNVDDAFRRFSKWFDDRLAETIGATRGAIEAALQKRRQHAEEAEVALGQLRRAANDLSAIRQALLSVAGHAPVSISKSDTLSSDRGPN